MKTLLILFAALALSQTAVGAEPKAEPKADPKVKEVDAAKLRADYPNLLKVQRFNTVDLVVIGNKERLGMKEQELNDFVALAFKQLFKGYEQAAIPPDRSKVDPGEYGTINLLIEVYPIARNIELKMGSLGSDRIWKTNELRVSTNNSIRDARLLKTSVATMMARAATTLRAVQGK